jgi:hypothetical protein
MCIIKTKIKTIPMVVFSTDAQNGEALGDKAGKTK